MNTKPAVGWLNSDNDARLISKTQTILLTMGDNATIYTLPNPTLPVVQTALDQFVSAYAAADGGTITAAAKKAARTTLTGLVRNLASYVSVACNNNMENLLLSGFPPQSSNRTPNGVSEAPANLTLTLGTRSGEMDARADAINGAAIYNWRLMANGQTTPVQTAQTTAASTSFAELTPGGIYTVDLNAVNSAGTSDWSQPVSQMVV